MATVIAFEPRRFATAAQYYLQGRPAYADQLIRRVSTLLALNNSQRLLDLGTGPGLLAVAFAPHVAEVTAIDPEPEMLRIAGDYASENGVQLKLIEGSSYTLDSALGLFNLVTIGRAFHWMDRQETLQSLDQLVRPGGAIALFSTKQPASPENRWNDEFDALRETHGESNSVRAIRRSADWVPHEEILLNSPFSALERISIIERRTTPVGQLVTRALSLSGSSPGRIGTSKTELETALHVLLSKYAVNGSVQEVVESEALIAFRPAN